jgi:hypothetical protein
MEKKMQGQFSLFLGLPRVRSEDWSDRATAVLRVDNRRIQSPVIFNSLYRAGRADAVGRCDEEGKESRGVFVFVPRGRELPVPAGFRHQFSDFCRVNCVFDTGNCD